MTRSTRSRGVVSTAAATLLLTAMMAGCSSYLDVNTDPNNPVNVRIDLTLPGMEMAFAHRVLGPESIRYGNLEGSAGFGTEWMQQWSWNNDRHTYAQFQWYEVANLDTDGFWDAGYADVMQEAKNIMAASEGSDQPQYHGIAKLIFAWNASQLTDAFGPIPLDEAFDPTNANPGYETQQQVYATVYQMIDEAIQEMQTTGAGAAPAGTDLVYGGDMAKWVKLAYSLKARFEMRLAYAPGESATDHAQAALTDLASGLQGPGDAPQVEYAGGSGARQPWYDYEDQEPGEPSRSSTYMIDMLKANNDPRLPIMAVPTQLDCPAYGTGYQHNTVQDDCTLATTTIYRGNPSGGVGEPDSAISRIGPFFSADSMAFVWYPYEDTRFLAAEAYLIQGDMANADAQYRAGIQANMERLGVASADITTYLNSKMALGSEANPLQALITEKYVSNFLRDEVWVDYRRTGYPVPPDVNLVIPAGESLSTSGIPQRLRTPASEITNNGAAMLATGISVGEDGMMTKVWWASGS